MASQFNGDPLDYERYRTECISFLRDSYAGPLGTMPVFFSSARLEEMYDARGLSVPAYFVPPARQHVGPLPIFPSVLDMSVYNAKAAEITRANADRVIFETAVAACRDFMRDPIRCGPIPLFLVNGAADALVTDDTLHFVTLDAAYGNVISEQIEVVLDDIPLPFDGSTTLAARFAKDEATYKKFTQQTGEVIADKLKYFNLRKIAAGHPKLIEAKEKYTDDYPALRDQNYADFKTRLLAAATKFESAKPVPLFGGSATKAPGKTPALPPNTYARAGNAGTWTRGEILFFATLPCAKWTKYCYTCGTHCSHDSSQHRARDGPKDRNHDDTALALPAGAGGNRDIYKSPRAIEAIALKHKYKIV
jgi:hypothetical protein